MYVIHDVIKMFDEPSNNAQLIRGCLINKAGYNLGEVALIGIHDARLQLSEWS